MTALKAVVAIVVSAAGALAVAIGPNGNSFSDLGTKDWLLVLATILGSGGLVWLTENGPWHTYIKTVIAFLSAGVASLVTALDDGVITQAEWLIAFSAAVVATGLVFQASNKPRS